MSAITKAQLEAAVEAGARAEYELYRNPQYADPWEERDEEFKDRGRICFRTGLLSALPELGLTVAR